MPSFMTELGLTNRRNRNMEKLANGNKVADVGSTSSVRSLTDSCAKIKIDEDHDGSKDDSVASKAFKLFVCSLCGILFGISFEKTRVFEPKAIRDQMVFESFIMLKMFLAAVATGQICLSVLSFIPSTKPKFQRALEEYFSTFSEKGILTSAVGAFALGSGMTLAGACPGMVLAQVGAWAANSIFTLLGCLVGALAYGMSAPYIVQITKPKSPYEKLNVNEKLKLPYVVLAIPMSILLCVAVFLLEYFWDWEKDLKSLGRDLPPYPDPVARAVAWRPFTGGIIIGVLQIPLVLVVTDTVGGSSSYVTIVSQWVVTKRLQEMFPYLAKARCGVNNWWQVLYVMGAVVGGVISSVASDTIATTSGVSIPTAFFGGMLMLIGARFASGCTSGHGLSGMGLLAWLSMIAVPFMFGGGIATAFAMKATGALDHYVSYTLQT